MAYKRFPLAADVLHEAALEMLKQDGKRPAHDFSYAYLSCLPKKAVRVDPLHGDMYDCQTYETALVEKYRQSIDCKLLQASFGADFKQLGVGYAERLSEWPLDVVQYCGYRLPQHACKLDSFSRSAFAI